MVKNDTILKKFSLMMALLIISIMGVQAVTTLNSCGKNSGWTNGETYILNFTTIDNTYPNNYCFRLDNNTDSLIFIHNSSITDTSTNVAYFMQANKFSMTNTTFKNITFNKNANQVFYMVYIPVGNANLNKLSF